MTHIKINRKDKDALIKVCAIASIYVYFHDEVGGDLIMATIELEDTTAIWYLARMLENQLAIEETQAMRINIEKKKR